MARAVGADMSCMKGCLGKRKVADMQDTANGSDADQHMQQAAVV